MIPARAISLSCAVIAIAVSLCCQAEAGDRLILDPGPAAGASSGNSNTTEAPATATDDLDKRVRDLEAQKADVSRKGSHPVTLDISGSVSAQVQAVRQ